MLTRLLIKDNLGLRQQHFQEPVSPGKLTFWIFFWVLHAQTIIHKVFQQKISILSPSCSSPTNLGKTRQDFQDLGFPRERFQVRANFKRAFLRSLQDLASLLMIFPGSWKASREVVHWVPVYSISKAQYP